MASHQSARYTHPRWQAGGVAILLRPHRCHGDGGDGLGAVDQPCHGGGHRRRPRRESRPLPRAGAWPSRATGAEIVSGRLGPTDQLVIASRMNEGGIVFADGIEHDRLDFSWGRTLTVRVADEQLRFVPGKAPRQVAPPPVPVRRSPRVFAAGIPGLRAGNARRRPGDESGPTHPATAVQVVVLRRVAVIASRIPEAVRSYFMRRIPPHRRRTRLDRPATSSTAGCCIGNRNGLSDACSPAENRHCRVGCHRRGRDRLGCRRSENAGTADWTGRSRSRAGPKRNALDSADQAMQAKLEGPITCINRTLAHLGTARRTYASAVALIGRAAPGHVPDIGLSDRPTFKIEPYERNNEFALGCADAPLISSVSLSPAIADLDGASRQLALLLRAIVPIGNQAEIYYGQEDWKDDQDRKGRQLDSELGPKLASLVQQDDVLRAAVLREQSALRKQELRHDRDGARPHLSVARARPDVYGTADDGPAGAAAHGRTLTETNVAAAISPFQEEFDAGTAYAASHQDEAKPNARGMRPLWFDLQPSATALLQQAKDLRRACLPWPDKRMPADRRPKPSTRST